MNLSSCIFSEEPESSSSIMNSEPITANSGYLMHVILVDQIHKIYKMLLSAELKAKKKIIWWKLPDEFVIDSKRHGSNHTAGGHEPVLGSHQQTRFQTSDHFYVSHMNTWTRTGMMMRDGA